MPRISKSKEEITLEYLEARLRKDLLRLLAGSLAFILLLALTHGVAATPGGGDMTLQTKLLVLGTEDT